MAKLVNVMHSLVSCESLVEYLSYYDIGKILECRFLTRGLNDSYLVTTEKGKFVFRVYRKDWRNYSAIEFELEVICYLHNKNIFVSYPIKKIDGNYINDIPAPEGVRYAVLFSYAKGKTPNLDNETSNLLGKTLAMIHQETSSFQSKCRRGFLLDLNHLIDEPMSFIAPIAELYLKEDENQYLKYVVNNLIGKLSSQSLEIGLCHGDFHDWNVNYSNGKLTVFDFDCCSLGYRAYDIAVFLWNLKNNYKDKEKMSWNSFFDGYCSIRTISTSDISAIPYFVSIRRIWLLGVFLQNKDVWGTNWIKEENISNFVNLLKQDETINIKV